MIYKIIHKLYFYSYKIILFSFALYLLCLTILSVFVFYGKIPEHLSYIFWFLFGACGGYLLAVFSMRYLNKVKQRGGKGEVEVESSRLN
jgi:hypothetical protein